MILKFKTKMEFQIILSLEVFDSKFFGKTLPRMYTLTQQHQRGKKGTGRKSVSKN